MPARLTCPHCDAEFKPKNAGPSGRAVLCPDCDRKFVPDDEDRPRRPRRGDEGDDRPRRKTAKRFGKKRAKKRNPLVIILPVGSVFLLAVVGVVLYLTVIRDHGPGGSADRKKVKIDNELLAALPDGPYGVNYVELETVLNHPRLPDNVRRDFLRLQGGAFHGIPAEDVQAFAYGSRPGKDTLILKPKAQPVDQSRILSLTRAQPAGGGKGQYKTNDALMVFPTASLISLQPEQFGLGGGMRPPPPSMQGAESPFPSLYAQVKGPIWHGGGTGNGRMGGRSGGPQGVKEWSATFRYGYTQITLLDDVVESFSVTELASEADAIAYWDSEEGRRNAPGEGDNIVTRTGTRVTVKKVRTYEEAERLFGEVIPPGL